MSYTVLRRLDAESEPQHSVVSPPTAAQEGLPDRRAEAACAAVEIVVPVYNEEQDLEESIRRLREYLDSSFPFSALVTVADNASTDSTWQIALELSQELPGVKALHLEQKGRGRALRAAWLQSEATVVAYMDVDLSTDLDALLPLVAPLLSGHSQVAIGTRLAHGARVIRGPKREFISRSYNLLLRSVLRNRFSDAQCGFKAIRRDTASELLPLVNDNEWFFDTELLILAERSGLRISEVAVDWVDDPDSRVHIGRTARDDLRGVWRLLRRQSGTVAQIADSKRSGISPSYASIGLTSTVCYLVLYFLLRGHLGTYLANIVAFAICTVGSTLAHYQFDSGPRSAARTRITVGAGVASFVCGAGLTTTALALGSIIGATSSNAQLVAILIGTAAAALVRFVLLNVWTYRMSVSAGRPGISPVPIADNVSPNAFRETTGEFAGATVRH